MKILITTSLFLTLFVVGCATGPQLSQMQKRQMTTKMIEGSYEDAFRATMTILQDQGYVIKQTDMNSGLIVANVDRESSKGSQFLSALFTGAVSHKNTIIEVSATINKLNETSQEIRLNIQETEYSGNGGKTDINQIYDPKVYENLFNQIVLEVKRREAING
ncbi:MAG TPA: hypothetical protein VKA26_12550 [Ignavibacteriaceae bacterium]|nr:hypothetical protein [Ignavibacteriaceae bacterium]